MSQYTNSNAEKVKLLAAYGFTHKQIAARVGLTEEELEQLYGHELKIACTEMKAKVAGQLFKQAMSGSLTAIIFWLKTRAGWSERRHQEPEAEVQELETNKILINVEPRCNTRDRCYKSGPKERLAGLKTVHAKLLGEVKKRGMALDFARPDHVELVEMRGLYEWPHKKRDGSEDAELGL